MGGGHLDESWVVTHPRLIQVKFSLIKPPSGGKFDSKPSPGGKCCRRKLVGELIKIVCVRFHGQAPDERSVDGVAGGRIGMNYSGGHCLVEEMHHLQRSRRASPRPVEREIG